MQVPGEKNFKPKLKRKQEYKHNLLKIKERCGLID